MVSTQNLLIEMLKSKGTGKTMSQHLSSAQLDLLPDLLRNSEIHLATKATLLTALLALPASPDEKKFIQHLSQNPQQLMNPELLFLWSDFSYIPKQSVALANDILHLIKGVSLNQDQCNAHFAQILNSQAPDYLIASFLEALRLKEESPLENLTCYQQLMQLTSSVSSTLDTVVDLSVSYDGFNRTPYLSLFVAPVLAALGLGCVVHGARDMGPKYGINPAKILNWVGYPITQSLSHAKIRIDNPLSRWAYIDQATFCPSLANLQTVRNAMVKRPLLSTLEKLLIPISGRNRTALITSYTHPPYKAKMAQLVQSNPKITDYMIVRGVEGSIQLALDRQTPIVTRNRTIQDLCFIRPDTFGISAQSTPQECSEHHSLQLGLDALHGQSGWALDCIIYLASSILNEVFDIPVSDALHRVRNVIINGNALQHWEAGIK